MGFVGWVVLGVNVICFVTLIVVMKRQGPVLAREAEQRAAWRAADEAEEMRRRAAAREEYHEAHYGERHQAERAKYAETIKLHGGKCKERTCVMPTRRIPPGSYWELAHDHQAGRPDAYLGPAHQQCNEWEARERGVLWPDMDDDEAFWSRVPKEWPPGTPKRTKRGDKRKKVPESLPPDEEGTGPAIIYEPRPEPFQWPRGWPESGCIPVHDEEPPNDTNEVPKFPVPKLNEPPF